MPVTPGLSTVNTRLVNKAFATAYFPEVLKSVYPRICRTTESHSVVEPFAFNGAAPPLTYYQGEVNSSSINSYSMKVPNPLWRNMEYIKRNQLEFDQTRTLYSRTQQFGVRVAQTPDYLLAYQMINGSTAGSQTWQNFDDSTAYTLTYDNQPIYGTHTVNGSNFTNILTGNLPATIAALNAQNLTVTANQMQQDVQNIIQFVGTLIDDKGMMLFPGFDPEKQLVLVYPPCLHAAAALAFDTVGTLGGTNGSSSGSTTNIGKRIVKDIINFPLLQGCINITSQGVPTTISPTAPTDYYYFIDGAYTSGMYLQTFTPPAGDDTVPRDYDVDAESKKILAKANTLGLGVTKEMADRFAAAEVATNLNAIGENAQESVYAREQFFYAGRQRCMVFQGLWWNAGKISPQGFST